MGIIYLILFSTVSYLIGSIPFGFLITKIFKNKDVREYGSKNTGATNVLRVAGKKLGLFCLFLDIVKGFIPVTLIVSFSYNLLNGNISIESYKIFLGFFAIAGHIWPVYLKFKGGKGVATAFGVLLGIEPVSVIAVFCIWIIIFLIFKIVSVGSLVSALILPFIEAFRGVDLKIILFTLIIIFIIIFRHKSNISRIAKGIEKKI